MEEELDPRLQNPCTMRVVGSTMSGKTHWVSELLKYRDQMFREPIPHVLYCYGSDQPLYDHLKKNDSGVTFHHGLIDGAYKSWLPKGGVVVFDDLMDEVVKDDASTHLFTKGAHHDHITPISIEQNLDC